MPGLNRRGPEGMGPMTGGGRGLCNAADRTSNRGETFMNGAGRGKGFGSCRRQPGTGRRAGFGFAGMSGYDRDNEELLLRQEEAMLKDELEAVKQRLEKIKDQI